MNDQNDGSREAMVPKVLGMAEKQLDSLKSIIQELVERLEPVTRAAIEPKSPLPERAPSGVQMAERIAKISEGIENSGGRLRSLLDCMEI